MTAQTSPVSLFKFNAQDIRVVTIFTERRSKGTNKQTGAAFEAVRIAVTPEGRKVLALWHSQGLLPMKKGAK